MRRYPHYWWHVRGKYCPSRIAILDCDTAPGSAGRDGQPCPDRVTAWHLSSVEMRAGVVGRTTQRHGGEVAFLWPLLSSLCNSRESTWVFMPNAGRLLPLLGFWDRLENGRIELCGRDWKEDRGAGRSGEDRTEGLCVIEDPPTLILCRPAGKPGKWLILDVQNYGIECVRTSVTLSARCDWYIRGLGDIVSTLRQGVAVSLRGTAASQAVQILRTRYDCVRLHCHTHGPTLSLERAAYYGGRCECYYIGEVDGPVWHLDIRSCYPAVCMELPIPVSIRRYHGDSISAGKAVGRDPSACVAHVRVRCEESQLPLRRDGLVLFPVGNFDTCLAGPELLSAVRAGMVRQVYSAAEYTCAPALAGFYRDGLALLHSARQYGKRMVEQWLKRVLNALPGKFGEPGRRWVPVPSRTEMGPYCEWTGSASDGTETRYRNIAWNTQRLETHGESYNSMPAVAGWITSAARLRLWHYLETAGRGNVWYADTDSLICNRAGFDRLLRVGAIREGEAGHLRLVGAHGRCVIYGIRHYQLDSTVSCAGVPRGAIGEGESRPDYFARLRTAAEIALGRKPGTGTGGRGMKNCESYRHGNLADNGTITPLRIDDGDSEARLPD